MITDATIDLRRDNTGTKRQVLACLVQPGGSDGWRNCGWVGPAAIRSVEFSSRRRRLARPTLSVGFAAARAWRTASATWRERISGASSSSICAKTACSPWFNRRPRTSVLRSSYKPSGSWSTAPPPMKPGSGCWQKTLLRRVPARLRTWRSTMRPDHRAWRLMPHEDIRLGARRALPGTMFIRWQILTMTPCR